MLNNWQHNACYGNVIYQYEELPGIQLCGNRKLDQTVSYIWDTYMWTLITTKILNI